MVVYQLESEALIAQYLTALYDWSWFGTVRCVERALHDRLPVSGDLLIVLSAMLAEKRFDPVYGSRVRAEEWTSRLDLVTGFRFSQTTTIVEVVREIERLASSTMSSWFETWKTLFRNLGNSSAELNEADIAFLSDSNPFIGWTASQMIRWCRLSPASMRQVRALFVGARWASDDTSRAIRWRAVHALGRHPSVENLQLLLNAIDSDDYWWVVYGAVRSALEMAAIQGADMADQVLKELNFRLPAIPAEPLSAVAWASRYDGADEKWKVKVWPLLVQALDLQTDEAEKERWRQRLAAFRRWANLEVNSE
jgi:hypothetical protein